MDTTLIVILVVLVGGFIFLIFQFNKKFKDFEEKRKDDQGLLMLQNQLNEVNKTVDSKLTESTRMLQQQFGQSAKIISEVTEKLTKLDDTNKQVLNFSDQLKNKLGIVVDVSGSTEKR